MKAGGGEDIRSGGIAAARCEERLARLEALLAEQVALARKGKLRQIQPLVAEARQLLAEPFASSAAVSLQDRTRRITSLYNQLTLTLEAQKSELAGQVKRLRTGRLSLKAYREGSSSR